MKHNPLVSVFIPTRNRLKLLKRALNSVLMQTYENIQIVIVDDFSTDGTRDYLSEIKDNKKIKVIFNEKQLGATKSKNIGVLESDGEFVTCLDDDDFFLPDRIERFVNYWKNLDKHVAGLFDMAIVMSKYSCNIRNTKKKVSLKDLRKRNYIGNMFFLPKKHIVEAGLFDPDIPAWHDWDLLLRVSKKFGNFESIDCVGYVVDISHNLPRMTTDKEKKIRTAMKMLMEKNKPYTFSEKSAIIIALNEYPQVKLTFLEISILLLNGRFRSFFKGLKKYFKG